ncbi:hypothetical protein [Solirubrobacter soli]|uniref:hypothetical protein n=1 Tax=Solirubrobacter soli TaxID=363832 RepID=UPI0004109D3E|nr:hypothetical protein [Solirubrobacter soli]
MSDLPQLETLLVDAAVRRRRRRRVVGGARVAVLAAAAVVAFVAIPRSPSDVEVPAVTPGSVEANYHVFRRPATPADGGAESRAIGSAGGAFLRRMQGEVCLVLKGRGTGRAPCGPVTSALDGFLKQDFDGGVAFAFSDGVRKVSLILADGDEKTLPVVDNGVVVDLPSPVVRANWTAADGSAKGTSYAGAAAPPADMFAILRAPSDGRDELPGLPGSRLALRANSVKVWLVPRRTTICVVMRIKDRSASGCQPIGIANQAPMAIAMPGSAGRVVVVVHNDAITDVSVSKGYAQAAYTANVFMWTDTGGPRTLRYVTRDGPVRKTLRKFPFNARMQAP